MKLKEYAKRINELIEKGYGELECFYSIDDEGNGYGEVCYNPTVEEASELDEIDTDESHVILVN